MCFNPKNISIFTLPHVSAGAKPTPLTSCSSSIRPASPAASQLSPCFFSGSVTLAFIQ